MAILHDDLYRTADAGNTWLRILVGHVRSAAVDPKTLHATGWVRTVAGVQFLISVYLLALWALTYFG